MWPLLRVGMARSNIFFCLLGGVGIVWGSVWDNVCVIEGSFEVIFGFIWDRGGFSSGTFGVVWVSCWGHS